MSKATVRIIWQKLDNTINNITCKRHTNKHARTQTHTQECYVLSYSTCSVLSDRSGSIHIARTQWGWGFGFWRFFVCTLCATGGRCWKWHFLRTLYMDESSTKSALYLSGPYFTFHSHPHQYSSNEVMHQLVWSFGKSLMSTHACNPKLYNILPA